MSPLQLSARSDNSHQSSAAILRAKTQGSSVEELLQVLSDCGDDRLENVCDVEFIKRPEQRHLWWWKKKEGEWLRSRFQLKQVRPRSNWKVKLDRIFKGNDRRKNSHFFRLRQRLSNFSQMKEESLQSGIDGFWR